MKCFDGMMLEIKQMKCKHSEWIPQLDNDIHDYIKNMHARKDSRMMMRVLLKAQKWTMNSKIYLILMICVE